MKPKLPDLLGTSSEHKYDSNKSDNKSGKGSSNSKQNNNNSGSTQGKAPLPNRRSPLLRPFFETWKDRKLTPQECQRCLDNKLCLFVHRWTRRKDCPKSSSASAKAQVSKSDQDKSASSGTDSKKY